LLAGAIQITLGAALLTAFAGGALHPHIPKVLQDNFWMPVPPPPRPVQPVHRTDNSPVHSETPPIVDPIAIPTSPFTLAPLDPMAVPGSAHDPLPVLPHDPPAPPAQPPVGARPLGDPAQWITTADYPQAALQLGWGGVTRLHLDIASDGRVSTCRVTVSSGHPALDAVACDKVTRRAHFAPARNSAGRADQGSYDSAIRWQVIDPQ
jgi:protein TonB